jgi:hypothetical protein
VIRVELNRDGTKVSARAASWWIDPVGRASDRPGNLYAADFTGVILKVTRRV